MEILVKATSAVFADEIPLCPYCDQPIMGGAIIIKNAEYEYMCLAHGDCYTDQENEQ